MGVNGKCGERGSIPPTNYSHISSVGRALVVVMMPEVMGSIPICDTNFGGPSGERRSFPESG